MILFMPYGSSSTRSALPASADSRRVLRQPVKLQAMLRKTGLTKFEIGVSDLSAYGMRGETSFTLPVGATVWLALPGLAGIEAEIAWARNYSYGFRFKQPLHTAVVDHIVRLSPTR